LENIDKAAARETKVKLLFVHNSYKEPGGEDNVVAQESAALRAAGHSVEVLLFDNDNINSRAKSFATAIGVVRNRSALTRIARQIDAHRPDVVHFHNFFPLVSPAALGMVADLGVPVVQTLHNYRVICSGGMLMRNNAPCEACVGKAPFPALRDRCYRGSLAGTAAAVVMGAAFRRVVSARKDGITLIALTRFARDKLAASGLDPAQIVVKPNFGADAECGASQRPPSLLFVGRLSAEKGAETLLDVARQLPQTRIDIIGDGPQRDLLRANAASNVHFHGRLSHAETLAKIRGARALLMPSRWYEGFPMTVVEAFSCGTPVIASDIGSLQEIIEAGLTGLLVPPHDVFAWAAAAQRAHNESETFAKLGRNARKAYENHYCVRAGLAQLTSCYEAALQRKADGLPIKFASG
jgi:glycosyltransferase involved in cell wall biosynthesis